MKIGKIGEIADFGVPKFQSFFWFSIMEDTVISGSAIFYCRPDFA